MFGIRKPTRASQVAILSVRPSSKLKLPSTLTRQQQEGRRDSIARSEGNCNFRPPNEASESMNQLLDVQQIVVTDIGLQEEASFFKTPPVNRPLNGQIKVIS